MHAANFLLKFSSVELIDVFKEKEVLNYMLTVFPYLLREESKSISDRISGP
jgi:hypothetical protein